MANDSLGETPMNNCSARWRLLEFKSPKFVLLSLLLAALTLFTIAGNCLVVAAIVLNRRLRSVTGILILSLAVADLLVGVFVLPFSVANQVLQEYWIFGNVWCQIWLAVDVWMCTSSIYNLVAISINRYVAIVKPLNYAHLVTKRQARMAIAIAWTLSFLICLPPMIIYWPSALATTDTDSCICTPMNNSSLYIIYSACGSFFIPMVLIAIIYYRIYGAARRTTNSLVTGRMMILPTSKTSIVIGQAGRQNSTPSADGQLRIHRGGTVKKDEGRRYKHVEPKNATVWDRPSSSRYTPDLPHNALASGQRPARNSRSNVVEVEPTVDTKLTTDAESENQLGHLEVRRVNSLQNKSRNYCSTNLRYVDDVDTKPTNAALAKQVAQLEKIKLNNQVGHSSAGPCNKRRDYSSIQLGHGSSSSCNTRRNYSPNYGTPPSSTSPYQKRPDIISTDGSSARSARSTGSRSPVPNKSSLSRRLTARIVHVLSRTVENLNKKNRYQKRLSAEIKAAKTVAIVTGCFVCCWLGFAVSYALQAVNVNVSSTLFGIFFWLGQVPLFVLTHCNKSEVPLFRYSNSALNPVIYTVFNREYRWTFKRMLICRSVKKRHHRMSRTWEASRFSVAKSEILCRQSTCNRLIDKQCSTCL